MKKALHNHSIQILDDTYVIVSDEPEDHVAEAANYVHLLMQEYVTKAQHLPLKTVAVFTALKLASALLKHEKQLREHAVKHNTLLTVIENQIKRGTMQE